MCLYPYCTYCTSSQMRTYNVPVQVKVGSVLQMRTYNVPVQVKVGSVLGKFDYGTT
jgi:hypothetical protein